MSSTKSELPTTPKKKERFERKYMTPKELAQRWGVSESAIHHGKAESNNLQRFYFGKALRFLCQEVYDYEANKKPLGAMNPVAVQSATENSRSTSGRRQ